MQPIFCNILLQQKNKVSGSCLWLVMLSMEPALFRQISSGAKFTDARRDFGCDPWSIHQPRPLLPNRSAGLCRKGHIRRGGLLRHVTNFYVRSQWQDREILFFRDKSALWKIRSHAETPCAQVSSRSIDPFKRYRWKAGPAKLKPIVIDSDLGFQIRCETFHRSPWPKPVPTDTTRPQIITGYLLRNTTHYRHRIIKSFRGYRQFTNHVWLCQPPIIVGNDKVQHADNVLTKYYISI